MFMLFMLKADTLGTLLASVCEGKMERCGSNEETLLTTVSECVRLYCDGYLSYRSSPQVRASLGKLKTDIEIENLKVIIGPVDSKLKKRSPCIPKP